jgi:hypothetical protein
MDSVQCRRDAREVFLLCKLLQALALNERLESERAILKALQGKALRSYWHLVKTSSRHDEDFGIQHFNLAFLELWSMVNGFDGLFYQLPTPERVKNSNDLKEFNCRVRTPSSFNWKVYIKAKSDNFGEWNQGQVPYPSKNIKKGILVTESKSRKISLKKVADGMHQTYRTEWLLELDNCDTVRYGNTRKLRNKLSLEHGTETSKLDASLIDIQDLASLWSDFLAPLKEV